MRRKGFTLIELLIAIAIIGILASIVLVLLTASKDRAKVAAAQTQMSGIVRAAQKIHTEYGYYPSDSDRMTSPCLQDYDISATGAKWTDVTNVCEDPWGTNYRWVNKCVSGTTIARGPGSPENCAQYSDNNSSLVGVISFGKNKENDNCGGDDICLGILGFTDYTSPPPSETGFCSSSYASCTDYTDESNCSLRVGCGWTANTCSGQYYEDCCFGNSLSCNTHSTSSNCTGAGCTWSGCTGTPTISCSSQSSQSSCEAIGCSWSATCQGTPTPCSSFSSTTCSAHSVCSYSGKTRVCSGTRSACSTYTAAGQAACVAEGCSYSAQCTGTPSVSCTAQSDSSACTSINGCAWQGCTGSSADCSSQKMNQSNCELMGCTWAYGSCPGTSGTYSNMCSFTNQTECSGKPGCSWALANCAGTAVDCSTKTDQPSCQSAGCTWNVN